MKLFFRDQGEGKPLLVLHGLFGSSDNWMTLAKGYAEKYRVIIPDLRNHGQSPHSSDFNYQVMADDVLALIKDLSLEKVSIIGHSMGGKVAMKLAVKYPDYISKLIIADISPRFYPVHHQTVIEAFRMIDLSSLKSRTEADTLISGMIDSVGERQFLLKNLKRTENGFSWKMDLDSISASIGNVGEGLLNSDTYDKEALFIRGSKSDYIKDDERDMIKGFFKNAKIKTIEGAGHWLHAEKPMEFFRLTMDFLAN